MKIERVIDLVDDFGIEKVLDSLNIEYQIYGEWVRAKCLFHGGDKFNLTYRNKYFYCFSECNRSYNIVDVAKQKLGLSFYETIKWLCDKIDAPFENSKKSSNPITEELLRTLKKANRFKVCKDKEIFKEIDSNVLDNIQKINHKILIEEGFDNEIVDYFNLGVAFNGFFDRRVTIPIDTIDGKIISMSGRLPDKYVDDFNPKYKHLNGALKGKTLYNISRAYKVAKEKGFIIVVEGFKSVWRLHQWKFDNAVATMGASLTDEQKTLLLKTGCKIYVCGDNDEAGKRFNQQVYNKCSQFVDVKKLDISKITDKEKGSVDEVYRNEFKKLLEE